MLFSLFNYNTNSNYNATAQIRPNILLTNHQLKKSRRRQKKKETKTKEQECKNMLRYLSLDIIWSPKLAVFLTPNSQKIVRFSEQIMSADKYQSILSVPDGGHCLFIGSF